MDNHTLDEFGEHDEDACYECLLGTEVKSECRCGKCCRLLIEVSVKDAQHEPKIKQLGSPIYSDPRGTTSDQRELIGYLLNSAANDHACAFLDRTTNLCTIYPTRPLCCRLFSCDGEGRNQLIELGWITSEEE